MGRMEKVNAYIKREIGLILQSKMEDARLRLVTVTDVRVSPDLHYGKVKFSVMGDQARIDEVAEGLNHAAGFIQRSIAKNNTMRFTPKLEFVYDPSIDYSARVEQTIQDIKGSSPAGEKQGDNQER